MVGVERPKLLSDEELMREVCDRALARAMHRAKEGEDFTVALLDELQALLNMMPLGDVAVRVEYKGP